MSLLSIFYAGDSAVVEETIGQGDLNFSSNSGVSNFDFSGGLHTPFLFPEDFGKLVDEGEQSFWNLDDGNLLGTEESGLFCIPPEEIEKLMLKDVKCLRAFSDEWNRRQMKEGCLRYRKSIWKSGVYWKIFGGGMLGLTFGYLTDNSSSALLFLLGLWVLVCLVVGMFLNSRIHEKKELREPVDWVPQLIKFQAFLRYAKESGVSVYYYWSL
jgi:hypothetical protein